MADSPFQLEPRFLTEPDKAWIDRFNAGEEWWSQEVTKYLRNHAVAYTADGLNQTILFSFPGYREIVGFVTVASEVLQLPNLGQTVLFNVDPPTSRIPAAVIPYFGVGRQYRGCGLAEEMHVQLLGAIQASWVGTRLIYLECWEENGRGVAFWTRLGYREFQRKPRMRPDDGGQATLLRMVYDRFALAV